MENKGRKLLVFAIIFVVYNILVFVIPFTRNGTFWAAYAFAVCTILAQAVADSLAFGGADSMRKMFLGIPIALIAHGALVIQLVICSVVMIAGSFIDIPVWACVIPCVLVLGAASVAIIKANWAKETINHIDTQHVIKTRFIQSLRAELASLVPRGANEAVRKELTKLADAARYSDPMSGEGLTALEANIEQELIVLKQAVINGDEDVPSLINELSVLLNERNIKCRMLK
ncbi:MAG: hypothetical protein LBS19_04400 [Clostridiales bacterium]|jgi:hypothetical protein|nr:hypothetical protein [Clostridiales bacterium]